MRKGDKQTNRQTDTDTQTIRLLDLIDPVGRFNENDLADVGGYFHI